MSNIVPFPESKYAFKHPDDAKASIKHFYDIGEAKSCAIIYVADYVLVRTPHGMGKFSYKEWNK